MTSTERDDDVAALDYSLREFYKSLPTEPEPGAAGLDGDLRAIFDDLIESGEGAAQDTRPAGELIRRLERQLMSDVFRWTGHFPEKTRSLMRDLAKRADALRRCIRARRRRKRPSAVTTLVTSLAMNFVYRGAYFPETAPPPAPAPARVTATPSAAPASTIPPGSVGGGAAVPYRCAAGIGRSAAAADPDDKGA